MPLVRKTMRLPDFPKRVMWYGKWWTRLAKGYFNIGTYLQKRNRYGTPADDTHAFAIAMRTPEQMAKVPRFALYYRRLF